MRTLYILFLLLFLTLNSASAQQVCDADLPESTPSSQFTVNVDKTVEDSTTGLMWKQCLEGDAACTTDPNVPGTYTFAEAVTQVNTANAPSGFAGYTDWRLPNIKELQSIVEEQCSAPAVNLTSFPNTPSEEILSNSPMFLMASNYWVIDFSSGAMLFNTAGHVRLVRDN